MNAEKRPETEEWPLNLTIRRLSVNLAKLFSRAARGESHATGVEK